MEAWNEEVYIKEVAGLKSVKVFVLIFVFCTENKTYSPRIRISEYVLFSE